MKIDYKMRTDYARYREFIEGFNAGTRAALITTEDTDLDYSIGWFSARAIRTCVLADLLSVGKEIPQEAPNVSRDGDAQASLVGTQVALLVRKQVVGWASSGALGCVPCRLPLWQETPNVLRDSSRQENSNVPRPPTPADQET